MRFVIVTGMSGAGKSTALKNLEDFGYFCVDNLPVELIPKFAEIAYDSGTDVNNVAIGVDIRSGDGIVRLSGYLEELKGQGYPFEILFLDASDEVIVKRYKETRRSHPLARSGRVEAGIEKERQTIGFLREMASYIIDTSNLLTRECRSELEKIFVDNQEYANFIITIVSFGFKYGIPRDADLVFDVRFLPNPYYVPELKPLTGNEKPVQEFVMSAPEAGIFLDKLQDMMKFLIPNYIKEGKNQLVVAIGCTGGKHRSVTLANGLYRALLSADESVRIEHRDIEKDAVTKG
ncbi:MAG: RNase adapter RapZ [Lachnospiraceae bacterium]|nr:RNase adapter RapZ [Lachnospiraceae bacterium]MBP3507875.1 RNase adapter RapZ [Lachnospiraceae bacterium]